MGVGTLIGLLSTAKAGGELLGTCVGRAGPQRFVGCLPEHLTQACLYGKAGLVHAPDCSKRKHWQV